ncbi:hypothetical protein [Escherichia coli]|uniref:Uncharacterized protein n=1 Tax=Escherichia phage 121Q TaxID=1555202 RepID=A0A097EXJ0_9CAUD|nr:hypothetical protein [Escherichia coli]YP_009101869.1 hypothetical protein PBI_121Q_282 [Escherichia phage 121Q]AIT14172.1 hypothetical protein PBI_121Q_282 [Escherichia phage 121Q]VVY13338.1 Uncharacterised protein [Escherichia coli]
MAKTIINTVSLAAIRAINVDGKRWTDSYGNTYHSCHVSVELDNGLNDLAVESFTYGYEDAYQQTALSLLKESVDGLNTDETSLTRLCNDLNIPLHCTVQNVKRKKDL